MFDTIRRIRLEVNLMDTIQYHSPFHGKTAQQIYGILTNAELSNGGLPRWPNSTVQTSYVGAYGPQIVQSGLEFLNILERDGAFGPGWRGLDYGCGFGRFAALLLLKAPPDQLDLVDAWPRSIDYISTGGFKNKCWLVSELLTENDLEADLYDFIMAFSVFTHFSKDAFEHNLSYLFRALKPKGRIYLTVRHEEFVPVKYAESADSIRRELALDGFWFKGTAGNLGREPIFGDTIVTPGFMMKSGERFGPTHKLGAPIRYQHVWKISKC